MIAIDRTRPPVNPGLPTFRLPAVETATLANGLQVLLVVDRRFPLMTARLGFQAGSKYEPAALAGLADSTAALLTEGTVTRSALEIAGRMAGLGGSLRADASPDALILSGSGLAGNTAAILELLADCARNAIFPEDEVALRKQNRIQELLAQLSDAAYLADERINQVIFGSHPYSRQEPTLETIEQLDRNAMAAFRDRHLRPSNAILVLAGDLPAEPLRSVEESFGGWADAPTPPAPPAVFAPPGRSLILVNRPGSVQADIRIARAAVARRDPAYFPLMVGNTVLGGGASSRLFMNVREEKGYAYDARSSAQPYRDGGMFAAITQVRNEVLGEALETVLEELRRMGSEPVADEELETAKNYMSGTFVLRLETPDSQAAQILGTRLLGLPLEYLEQYTPRVRAVSADAIQAAAGTYMNPDEAAIVVVGDAAALAPGLRAFGNLMVEEAQTE